MRLFPTIRRVIQAVGGAVSWQPAPTPGVAVSTVNSGSLAKPPVTAGLAVAQPPLTLLRDQKPAVSVALLGATGTAAQQAQTPAIAATPRISDFKVAETPALEIVRVQFDLTHRSGATTATNTGADAWTSPTNAQGLRNATNATSAGEALAARTRVLEAAYADFVAKTSLTISVVRLHFYASQAGTALNNGDLRLRYDLGAGFVTLATVTGDLAALTTPQTFDITGAVGGDWSKLDALKTAVEHRTDLAEALITAAVDAVELEVVAAATMTL